MFHKDLHHLLMSYLYNAHNGRYGITHIDPRVPFFERYSLMDSSEPYDSYSRFNPILLFDHDIFIFMPSHEPDTGIKLNLTFFPLLPLKITEDFEQGKDNNPNSVDFAKELANHLSIPDSKLATYLINNVPLAIQHIVVMVLADMAYGIKQDVKQKIGNSIIDDIISDIPIYGPLFMQTHVPSIVRQHYLPEEDSLLAKVLDAGSPPPTIAEAIEHLSQVYKFTLPFQEQQTHTKDINHKTQYLTN